MNNEKQSKSITIKIASWGGVGLSFATFLTLFSRSFWMLDLLTSFHVQYSLVLFLVVIVLLKHRRWKTAAIAGVALVYNFVLVLPAYFPGQQPVAGSRTLRLVSANVLTSNRNHEQFLNWIESEKPDLFLVMEVNSRWMAALNEVKEQYPHSAAFARSDNFGIALFSKLPMDAEIVQIGGRQLPSVLARVQVDDSNVTLLGTHPLPPGGARLSEWRNQQLRAVSQSVAKIDGPRILLGDLNVTPWSPHFRDLLDSTSLRDSRTGFGIQASWPASNPLFWIPIDHILVSDEIYIHHRRIGNSNGSDHFPVIVDFSISQD